MFSQFRNAVEHLAQQVPIPQVAGEEGNERRSSLDLRRSISQRSGTPDSSASPNPNGGRSSPSPANPGAVRKSNLEERLRRAAAIASGESPSSVSGSSPSGSTSNGKQSSAMAVATVASPSPSPDPSKKASLHRRTMSPASTPLPQSPALGARGDPLTKSSSNLVKSDAIPNLDLEAKDSGKSKDEPEGKPQDHGDSNNDESSTGSPKEKIIEEKGTVDKEEGQPDGKVTTGDLTEQVEGEDKATEGTKLVKGDVEEDAVEPPTNSTGSDGQLESQDEVVQDDPLPSSSTSTSLPPPPAESQGPEPTVSSTSPTGPDAVVENEKSKPELQRVGIESPSPEPRSTPNGAGGVDEEEAKADAGETVVESKGVVAANEPPKQSPTLPEDKSKPNVAVEELQQRLKQVEQRFTDVSTSFKRLQAEKVAADTVLRDLTPIDTIRDSSGLRDYLKNLHDKQEIFQTEINLLNGKLSSYEGRLEELRDVHRLEAKSQTDQIDKLKTQLQETEALFQASERAISEAEGKLALDQTDAKALQAEAERYKLVAKEEEEKRVKAVSLLKTVRQKLVRTEKEKEDALREVAASKERDRGEKEKEHVDRLRAQQEMEMVQIEKEKVVAQQKAGFEREVAALRERYEKEMAAVKGQLELEIITLKSSHSKELAAKTSQISTLENSLNSVTRDKNVFFEQLQIKQAETESAQSHLESLQHQNTELEFQLREANDRLALIKEEYADYQREQESSAREPVTSATDIAQMISATESKYEVKLAEMKRGVAVLEKERSESEANWSRKLKEKVRELEELKGVLGSAARSREQDINVVEQLKADLGRAREEVRILKEQLLDVPVLQDTIQDLKKAAKERDEEVRLKTLTLDQQAEEHKSREAQLKQANKTLREELRKVQSSSALLERQRNPGVGYWNRVAGDEPQSPAMSASELSGAGSPRPTSPAPSTASTSTTNNRQEEEVNLEYLRNVILQFLEHKDMRPSLVKVISIILHFTPQETRRLMAKV
ncbi:hypothetical protein D9611_006862 [Ephemerocybe angulata]|uniref:GRIP domain-containing protein n=1 Tax=Ephemerocybe angulata TaxID=980116 RepID=A0A8H5B1C9_9AGAR|nr:hypothetical protein D9611_006862 [Tulosesus angulatus]